MWVPQRWPSAIMWGYWMGRQAGSFDTTPTTPVRANPKLSRPHVAGGRAGVCTKLHDAIEFAELKAKIPMDAVRVRVYEIPTKNLRYKDPTAVDPKTDVIQTNKRGDPIITFSAPGRPFGTKKTVDDPTSVGRTVSPELANDMMAMDIIARKAQVLSADAVMQAAQATPEDTIVLHQVVLALGEEAASLKYERLVAEHKGQPTAAISMSRVTALKAVADTWLKRKDQLVGQTLDTDSPKFRAYIKFFMETLQEAMSSSGMRPEMVETVFSKLAKTMTPEWESEMKNRVKNAV